MCFCGAKIVYLIEFLFDNVLCVARFGTDADNTYATVYVAGIPDRFHQHFVKHIGVHHIQCLQIIIRCLCDADQADNDL